MEIHLTTSDGVPIYQQIVNQVKYLISSGRLDEGAQLPAVRKLAEQLLVNPNTVARAYRELETAGLLVTHRGSGVFISGGSSPLTRREQTRILSERIDALLAESHQLDFDVESLIQLVRGRERAMNAKQKKR